MNQATLAATIAALLFSISAGCFQAEARKWTITQREVEEQKRINSGEKANELTKKEAADLRGDMADIASRIDKMKSKNGGKLSYKDEGKIEKSLNDVTLKMEKKKLEKRVIPK